MNGLEKTKFFLIQKKINENFRKNFFVSNLNMNPENYSKKEFSDNSLEVSKNNQEHRLNRRTPIITFVGRGNVGKSTLVNRISGEFENGSIVYDISGITRDKTYKRGYWCGYEFLITDTGGFVFEDKISQNWEENIKEQALIAIQEANVIIFVVDGQCELTNNDLELANYLKFQKTPVVLAVNKCENLNLFETNCSQFWSLGVGSPIPVSGIHGTNTDQLLEKITSYLPKINFPISENSIKVAIIGKPNVGKSSILNFLTNKTRAIVSDFPGTTRDSCDSYISGGANCNVYNFIDTAGIRKKKMIEYGPEFFMVNRTFKSIQKSDCVLFVIDSPKGITEQDQKLSERIKQQGKACVIIFNKWDKLSLKEKEDYRNINIILQKMLQPIAWAEILFTSAVKGNNCNKIFDCIDFAVNQYNRRISTATFNEISQEAIRWRSPPIFKNGKQGKIYYCTQVSDQPPTIAMFVNNPLFFTGSYRKYIEGTFRNALGLKGTSIKIIWSSRR